MFRPRTAAILRDLRYLRTDAAWCSTFMHGGRAEHLKITDLGFITNRKKKWLQDVSIQHFTLVLVYYLRYNLIQINNR